MQWETVIGLEVHLQLATQSKIFSGSATRFGAEPNTQASAVDLAMPGMLPVLNEEAVRCAVMFGLGIGAEIGRRMDKTDRSCVGHALELAGNGKTVSWTNPDSKVTYQLRPLRADGDSGCRKFRLTAHGAFGLSEGRTVACPADNGIWDLAPEIRLSRR